QPDDDFVRIFLQNAYSGIKTQAVIDKFRPVLKKALNDFISETMNDKIKSALGGGDVIPKQTPVATPVEEEPSAGEQPRSSSKRERKIVTTEEELESYFIIKNLLKDLVEDINDITYKDTESYFNILYKANSRKWICRLKLSDNQKTLMIPDADKNVEKYTLDTIYDIEQYHDFLVEVLKRFL
ncbi:MAG: endonuclease, partial [Eubacteriales bacterium]|nr:endonuclease [Eubacteriales bacterium]